MFIDHQSNVLQDSLKHTTSNEFLFIPPPCMCVGRKDLVPKYFRKTQNKKKSKVHRPIQKLIKYSFENIIFEALFIKYRNTLHFWFFSPIYQLHLDSLIAKMKNFLNSHSRDQKVFIVWYKQSRFKKSVDGNETPHRGSVSFLIFKDKYSLLSLFSRMRSFYQVALPFSTLLFRPLQVGKNKYGRLCRAGSHSKSFRNMFLFYCIECGGENRGSCETEVPL